MSSSFDPSGLKASMIVVSLPREILVTASFVLFSKYCVGVDTKALSVPSIQDLHGLQSCGFVVWHVFSPSTHRVFIEESMREVIDRFRYRDRP